MIARGVKITDTGTSCASVAGYRKKVRASLPDRVFVLPKSRSLPHSPNGQTRILTRRIHAGPVHAVSLVKNIVHAER